MFENSGKKIKIIVKIFFYFFVTLDLFFGLFALGGGIYTYLSSEVPSLGVPLIIWGLFAIFISPLLLYILHIFPYGYGEIIDKLTEIADNTQKDDTKYE